MFPIKKITWILLVVLALATFYVLLSPVRASVDEDIASVQKEIEELSKAREQSVAATKPLEGQLTVLKAQLASIEAKLEHLSTSIIQKEKDLKVREEKLVVQNALLSSRIRSYYIRSFLTSPLIVILSQSSSGDLFRELTYRQAATKEDQKIISSITTDMLNLLTEKDKLEKDKKSMASLQVQVDQNATFLNGEVKKAKAYQADLSGKIAQLSAKQQELLAAKLGSLNLPKSAYSMKGGCSDDRNTDPGFSPRLALFSYGVPNRVGLNQFGAKGRAESGQNAQTILQAYYNADYTTGYNSGINIRVVGTNEYGQSFDDSFNIEDYVKHLYEMPASWPMEALKAQAIAARSYALATTNNGASSICPSQQCQVVKKEINDGNWQAAVDATRGVVLTSGGQPIRAWFSSTHGGYVFSSGDIGWNSTSFTKRGQDARGSIGSFSDLLNNAYDKDSPVFYCDWGSRAQYHSTAWLKPDEMADIVNSILLVQSDSSADPHILQTDKGDSDTWSEDKVRQELSKYRTPFNSITSGSVDADFGTGRTTRISFSGDAGSVDFPADVFKKYFNLRAPANINIVGPLFNIEKR